LSEKSYTLSQAQALADKKAKIENTRLRKQIFHGVVCDCAAIYEETCGLVGGMYWRINVAGQKVVEHG